jgi:identified by metaGeneAnnotator
MPSATAQLREELFDTLRRLKDGQIDAATAQAVSKISGNIIATVAVEIQAASIIGSDRIDSINGVAARELAGGVVHRLEG